MKRSDLTVVLKASKLCNLRCSYCYEYSSLGDESRLVDLGRLFAVLSEIETASSARMRFCWHGGEPLLLPLSFYELALKAQVQAFGSKRFNLIQTNLFRLHGTDLQKLRLMDHVSISFDVFGSARNDGRGVSSKERVLENMEKLRVEGMDFGAICVVTRETIAEIGLAFEFFNRAGISCRFLPYYRQSDSSQTARFGITAEERRLVMLQLVDVIRPAILTP